MRKTSEDYADELWAKKAIKEYRKEKHHEYKTLDDLKELLAQKQKFEQTKTSRIDQAIFESEKEIEDGGETIDLNKAWKKLDKKYYE